MAINQHPALELHKQLISLLKTDATLVTYVADRVFNYYPYLKSDDVSAVYPAIYFQTTGTHDQSSDCLELQEEYFTLESWSDKDSQREVREIARFLKKLVSKRHFTLPDGQTVQIHYMTTNYSTPAKGLFLAVLEFSFYYED